MSILRIRLIDDNIRFPGVTERNIFPGLRITIHRTARSDDDTAEQSVSNVRRQVTEIPDQRAIDVVIRMRVERVVFRFARSYRLVARVVPDVDPLRIQRIKRDVVSMQ